MSTRKKENRMSFSFVRKNTYKYGFYLEEKNPRKTTTIFGCFLFFFFHLCLKCVTLHVKTPNTRPWGGNFRSLTIILFQESLKQTRLCINFRLIFRYIFSRTETFPIFTDYFLFYFILVTTLSQFSFSNSRKVFAACKKKVERVISQHDFHIQRAQRFQPHFILLQCKSVSAHLSPFIIFLCECIIVSRFS